MSEKQPLVGGGPTAPPPAYQPPVQTPYMPPPQGGYQAAPPHQVSNTAVYIQPHQATRTVIVDIKPPNYLVLSIITMIFFCWIFGLIGLLVGMQVDSLWLSGSREEALRRSHQARLWNLVGMITGVVLYVFIVVVSVAINVSASASYKYN